MRFDQTPLVGGCGVNNIWGYNEPHHPGFRNYNNVASARLGAAGISVACFIDTPNCRKAYEELAKKFKISFQSVPRRNANSGRQFFMCVYEAKE